MRPIHVVQLDKSRPAVILTRERIRDHAGRITVAPVTSRAKGLSTEIPVGGANGLNATSVVACDNVATVRVDAIGRLIGYLLPDQERLLTEALIAAFDLEIDE